MHESDISSLSTAVYIRTHAFTFFTRNMSVFANLLFLLSSFLSISIYIFGLQTCAPHPQSWLTEAGVVREVPVKSVTHSLLIASAPAGTPQADGDVRRTAVAVVRRHIWAWAQKKKSEEKVDEKEWM